MAAKNARGKRKCKNKIAYNDIQKAKEAVIKLKKSNNCLTNYNIYICDHCGKYHIGHRPNKIFREMRGKTL